VRPFQTMNLSRQSEPLYRELAAVLREDVQRMNPGDYLPGEMQLAARFSVNRHTLRRAVDELVLEGRLLRRQGKGTQSLSALGHRVEAKLIERLRRGGSSEECRHLQLPDGSELIELATLRLLDGQPLSLIRHRFCASLAPLLADYQGGSLRQYLAERDLPLARTFSLIGARLPSREEASHLLMPRHAPLLSVLTLSRDPAGRAVELAQSSSRADRFQYQVAT